MNKAEARKIMMELRKNLSSTEFHSLSLQLENNLLNHFYWKGKTIATFLAINDKLELDTTFINEALEKDNKIVASISDFSDNSMQFYPYQTKDELRVNKWGIPEPYPTQLVLPKEIDIVLTPLLGFDFRGYRVGYGKGFYDRYAMQLRPDALLVGLSLFPPIENLSDCNEFDRPLDYCVTPNEIFTF